MRNYKLGYLYGAALISDEQRKRKDLVVDADGTDLNEFKTLQVLQNNIKAFVEDGSQLYIHSQTTGSGKAQPDDSLILTPNGFVTMKDIKAGDDIIGEDGKVHKVVRKFDRGCRPIYKLTFSDRTSAESCNEHIWRVKRQGDEFKNVELSTLLSKGLRRTGTSGWNYHIPVTKPLQLSTKKVSLDPYLLGCLIGDGSLAKSSIMFTNVDKDVLQRVEKSLPENCFLSKLNKKDFTVSCRDCGLRNQNRNPVKEALRNYKLLGTTSTSKFIPKDYLFNDYSTRLELLRGLMDTDGTISNSKRTNSISFATTSEQLMKDFKFLCQSLGGTCTVKLVEDWHYKDKEGNLKKASNFYRCQIKLPKGLNPFFCQRKRSRFLSNTEHEPYRAIRDIEYVGDRHCYCIMTDNPSGLYLTNDCVVTHNTSWALRLCQAYLDQIWVQSKLECRVLFVSVPKLLLSLKDNISEKNDYASYIKNNVLKADLVVWDDIASKSASEFEAENLFSMIDARIGAGKSNIYTSNLTQSELHECMGDRLASRVCTASLDIEFHGKDKRGIKYEK